MDAASAATLDVGRGEGAVAMTDMGMNDVKGKGRARRGLPSDLVAKLLFQLLLGLAHLHSRSTSGLVEQSLPKWLRASLSSQVTRRLIKSSKLSGAPSHPRPSSTISFDVLAEFLPSIPLRLLGTPTLDVWPGLVQMPDFKPTFPRWKSQPLNEVLPEMDAKALHLLSGMLTYDPMRRISAKAALQHPYFASPDGRLVDPPLGLGSYNPSSLLCAPAMRASNGGRSESLMASPII
ncbi:hypothetical protein P7C70_g7954, partial [Phenoliferia sp. Uapishka_3]